MAATRIFLHPQPRRCGAVGHRTFDPASSSRAGSESSGSGLVHPESSSWWTRILVLAFFTFFRSCCRSYSRDYLAYYATKFNSVEIDSTFYACPPPERFTRWYEITPPDSLFSLKVPQTITHEKCLLDCDAQIVSGVYLLKEKLGILLLQFGFCDEKEISSSQFSARLRSFLRDTKIASGRFAVEIRNKHWLTPEFTDLLREHKVALVLQDQGWMPGPDALSFDYFTTDFTYVRLLGDRKEIEKQTKTWDKVVVNRTKELWSWLDICQRAVKRGVTVFFYVNNHYAGHAPATVEQFVKMWKG
jgi:uncharacterized protein YecE (DUF72 family)